MWLLFRCPVDNLDTHIPVLVWVHVHFGGWYTLYANTALLICSFLNTRKRPRGNDISRTCWSDTTYNHRVCEHTHTGCILVALLGHHKNWNAPTDFCKTKKQWTALVLEKWLQRNWHAPNELSNIQARWTILFVCVSWGEYQPLCIGRSGKTNLGSEI